MLESLRFPLELSRGRRYPEPGHPYRNAFQRDRDRIVHSRAFRRLQQKTQVFAPALSDHFRNRLTHTIEVVQIARTAANVLGLNEDLAESLALVHDVGHPPFAHAGEEALNSVMDAFGESFDHNLQSLRIVDTLERRYPRFPGLNLTFEVREGIVKHSSDFEPGEFPSLDEYLPGLRPPLEAQLIDLADEIAYNASDLDDAFEAGLLLPEKIAEAVPAYAGILETVETQFPGASGRERFLESLRHLVDYQVGGLIEGTVAAARAAGIDSVAAVRAHSSRIAQFTTPARETSLELKRVLHAHVYTSGALELDRRESMERLRRLFEHLMNHPDELPEEDILTPLHRRVCDFIAGMTDRYFLRFYESQMGHDGDRRQATRLIL